MTTGEKIKVALVTTELAVGGAERCLVNLACGLNPARFEPVVYSLSPPPTEARSLLVRQLEQANVAHHFLNVRSSLQVLSAVGRLRRLLDKQRPDVLQSFLFHANVVGTLAARRAGVKRIVTGVRVAEPRGWRHPVERWICRPVDRIVCVSESVAQFCRETARLPADKLMVIPNGARIDDYPAEPADRASLLQSADGRPLVVIVGRLAAQKGLDWLIEQWPALRRIAPDAQLVLAGDGPQRDALEQQVRQLELGEQVHFAGWREDVANILAAADLLLLPSRWEGMPNAVLEAMASGKPVLAARVAGVVELLGPQSDRQSFEPGDGGELAARFQGLMDPKIRDELGRENRRRVELHYSLPTMVEAYQRLYESWQ